MRAMAGLADRARSLPVGPPCQDRATSFQCLSRDDRTMMNSKATVTSGLVALAATFALAAETIDPRGPIEYPGMKAAVDGRACRRRATHSATSAESHAVAGQVDLARREGSRRGLFRKEITLAVRPAGQCLAHRGCQVPALRQRPAGLRGPVDMGRDYAGGETRKWFYDYRDLTPYFTPGKNVIAAEVFRHWPVGSTVSRGQPGFLFEAEVGLPGESTLPGESKLTVKSDASWRAIPAAQFPNPAAYDAGKEPAGWRLPGFDASAWPACREVRDFWAPLVASEIPPLMEARYPVLRIEGLPKRTITADGSFRVVFDRVLSAYPTLKVKGGQGRGVTIKAQQQATMVLGRAARRRAVLRVPHHDRDRAGLYGRVEERQDAGRDRRCRRQFHFAALAYRGTFQCSDERLNRIWKVSRWAVQICLQTHHLDSPNHQEPISDPGDYLIEAMVNDYAFAQPWLARQDVRKFAWLLKDEKYHNFHTSYSIGWLQMLMDYYDYTGDKALVEEMAPYVHELMDTYASWRGKNGLISEAPNYMFMDWVDIGGFGCHHPPAVIGQGYLTAFYYHGLEMASRVAEMSGDAARVAKYAKLRARNRRGLQPRTVGGREGALSRRQTVPDFGQTWPMAAGRQGYRDLQPARQPAGRAVRPGAEGAASGDRRKGARRETAEHAALVHALGLSGDRPCGAVRPLRHAADAALEDRARDAIVPRNVERRRPQPRLVLDAAGADVGPRAGRQADLARVQNACHPARALRFDLGQGPRADAARRRGRVVEAGRR